MLLNVHSYYSLRYGTLSVEQLLDLLPALGYDTAVLTDINNSTGILEFIRLAKAKGLNGLAGIEFRNGDELLYIGIARNAQGFRELNELVSRCNLEQTSYPRQAPAFEHVFVVYPFGKKEVAALRENEFTGIQKRQLPKILYSSSKDYSRYVIWQPASFRDQKDYRFHGQLRAIHRNILLSQLSPEQVAGRDELFLSRQELLQAFEHVPQIIENTRRLLDSCSFHFDFESGKNKKTFTGTHYDDKLLLEKLATEGMKARYGNHKEAQLRVRKELEIIDKLGFSSYFLITWDIIRYGISRGFYHVGRGSGANSVVAYCLQITDVCPIELDLYFERFLNPKRKSPPDFDIDFGWDERDDVLDYIFKRYGRERTALLGAMSTFQDRSIIRELGKVYGLPKADIDRIIREPGHILNHHPVTELIASIQNQIEDFPNLRTIHASGVLISEEPITNYVALDLPPKGFPTVQFNMYAAEDIGFEKFDILSQRGIAHIKEAVQIIQKNKGVPVSIREVERFKKDPKIQEQLRSGDTIGCFYIESPAMRGLLKKLRCSDYQTLVAASSIIRPGVSKSGMMQAYIRRFHEPEKIDYRHPILEEQLKETYGVMVYQEDVLKVGHHFGGLDLADADVLRRMMSGKHRSAKHLQEIEEKYYRNTAEKGISPTLSQEIWRQIESFAGYSFSKAHSASFAVESFQSLFLRTYYPLEFYVAVINNFGGFYHTRVYIQEARKCGAALHLPCILRSQHVTTLYGSDIYLGFQHIQGLDSHVAHLIPLEQALHGAYKSLEDFIRRTQIGLEQLLLLIRANAFRFTGKNKNELQLEAYGLYNRSVSKELSLLLFDMSTKKFVFSGSEPQFLEELYDEIELFGFPVSGSFFDLLQTGFRGEVMASQMTEHVGRMVRMVGDFVTTKNVPTVTKKLMKFGTWTDANGDFFDTTHFPASLAQWDLKGSGVYLILGKVVSEFGFPSLEVIKCAKLPFRPDPRSVG